MGAFEVGAVGQPGQLGHLVDQAGQQLLAGAPVDDLIPVDGPLDGRAGWQVADEGDQAADA
jgi:hypothetical protein